jgi:cytochrome c oxidase assembly factor CtaG
MDPVIINVVLALLAFWIWWVVVGLLPEPKQPSPPFSIRMVLRVAGGVVLILYLVTQLQ